MAETTQNYVPLTDEQIAAIRDFKIGDAEFIVTEGVEIPQENIAHWTSIPPEKNIVLTLTRSDFDRLYFAITQLSAAVSLNANCMRLLTFGDQRAADATFSKAGEILQSADGNFRKFFSAIMKGAAANG